MSRWFRMYPDCMNNPKVLELNDREFRLWVQLLCVASENDGVIPAIETLKRRLKARLDHLLTGVERLLTIGLIDRYDGGFIPHNWNKRQYKSDTSSLRVKEHRARCNVSETPPDTDTDTDTDNTPYTPPKIGGDTQIVLPIGMPADSVVAKSAMTADVTNGQELHPIGKPKKSKPQGELSTDEIVSRLSPWVRADIALAFIENRRRLKCSHSEMAVTLLCAELAKCRDPTACVEKAILNNWKTVYPEKDHGQLSNFGSGRSTAYAENARRDQSKPSGIVDAANRVIHSIELKERLSRQQDSH